MSCALHTAIAKEIISKDYFAEDGTAYNITLSEQGATMIKNTFRDFYGKSLPLPLNSNGDLDMSKYIAFEEGLRKKAKKELSGFKTDTTLKLNSKSTFSLSTEEVINVFVLENPDYEVTIHNKGDKAGTKIKAKDFLDKLSKSKANDAKALLNYVHKIRTNDANIVTAHNYEIGGAMQEIINFKEDFYIRRGEFGNTDKQRLEYILKKYGTQEEQAANEFYDEFLARLEAETREPVVFGYKISDTKDGSTRGLADYTSLEVYLPANAQSTIGNSYSSVANTFVHEKGHLVTHSLYKQDPKFKAKIDELYEIAKAEDPNVGNKDQLYGTESPLEFIAEAFSNAKFQEFLNNIDYKGERTVLQKFFDNIVELLLKIAPNIREESVLREVLATTTNAMDNFTRAQGRVNGADRFDGLVMSRIEENGSFDITGDHGITIANDFANSHNLDVFPYSTNRIKFGVKPVNNPFFKKKGNRVFTKSMVSAHINRDVAPGLLYSKQDIEDNFNPSKDPDNRVTLYQKRKYVDNIESLSDISDSLGESVQIPSNDNGGFYMIDNKPYWRATSYLGLSDGSISPGTARNASRIGNIIDELGKRIFRGDDLASITRNEILDFVKNEDTEYTWNKEPIAEPEFQEAKQALLDSKQKLMDDYGIVRFHTDIVYWDHDERVGGEADVVGVKADGSHTVIDLKTRRSGMEGYDQTPTPKNRRNRYSDKVKHEKQTNFYSDMGAGILGVKYNAPIILMMSPQYEIDNDFKKTKAKEIENVQFTAMTDRGNTLEIIELERTTTESRFDFSKEAYDGQGENIGRYVASNRRAYNSWISKIRKQFDPEINKEATRKHIETLQNKFSEVEELIAQYIKLTNKKTHTVKAAELQENLKKEIEQKVDELELDDQLVLAEDFFDFSVEEINSLIEMAGDEFVAADLNTEIDLYNRIKKYRGIFSSAQDIFDSISDIDRGLVSDPSLHDAVINKFKELQGLVAQADSVIKSKQKSLIISMLKNSYLGSKAEIKYRNQFIKEFEAEGNSTEKAKELTMKKMSTEEFRDMLVKEYAKEIDELVSSVQDDMDTSTLWMISDVSTNNEYVQLMHTMLMQSKQRFGEAVNTEMQELDMKRRKLGLSKAETDALIDRDKDDNAYFVGKYTLAFKEKDRELLNEIKQLESELEPGDPKYSEKEGIIKYKKQQQLKWVKENTKYVNQRRIPNDKWLNPKYIALSNKQKDALEFFTAKLKNNDDNRIGTKKLGEYKLGATYYRLPGILKTTWENTMSGDFLGGIRKAFNEITEIEKDDEDFGSGEYATKTDDLAGGTIKRVYADLESKEILTVPVHFRKKLGNKQSTDLFSIVAMEIVNGIRYENDLESSRKGQLLLDFVSSKKFYTTVGLKKSRLGSIFARKGSTVANKIDGDASNTARYLEKMLKNQVYGMMHETSSSVSVLGKEFEINRIAGSIAGYTAFANMAFKVVGATTNLITGTVATALEAAGGEFFTKKDMAKANSIYAANFKGIAGDIGQTVKRNKINQMMKFFDVQSELGHLDSRFEKGEKGGLLEAGTLLGFQSMGEHQIHATLMLSLLNSIKATNKAGDYLNANGEVVDSKDKAASMVDIFEMKGGTLQVKEWAKGEVYNSFDTVVSVDKGGLGNIRALIKDRVVRTQGAFGKDTMSLLDRYWYGKLVKQFKKHIPPQTLNRFRGLNHVMTQTEDIDDKFKYFNYNAKTEEYGYYVSFLRHLITVSKEAKFDILKYKQVGKNEWLNLSLHERANIRKTVTELSYMITMTILAAAARAGLDDDDWLGHQLVYLADRQISDAGLAYYDPSEAWRLTETPAAAIRSISNGMELVSLILPWNWSEIDDVYKAGYKKGRYKSVDKLKRVSIVGDVFKQFEMGFVKKRFQSQNTK